MRRPRTASSVHNVEFSELTTVSLEGDSTSNVVALFSSAFSSACPRRRDVAEPITRKDNWMGPLSCAMIKKIKVKEQGSNFWNYLKIIIQLYSDVVCALIDIYLQKRSKLILYERENH